MNYWIDMIPDKGSQSNHDLVLYSVMAGYLLVNACGVSLAKAGVIHPPWDVLDFFTFVGPLLAAVVVVVMQIKVPRVFSMWAVVVFLLVMLTCFYVNLLLLRMAGAAV